MPEKPLESLLIVNADDFGETEAVTAGIAACMEKGAVTSTTIMANMPATETALMWAASRSRDHRLSFGVHLNLCEGRPLSSAPSLTGKDGHFHRKRALTLRAFAGRLDPEDVARELRAQISRVRDAGVEISHLDSHKHLHQLPGVGPVVARLAAEFKIARVRCTLEDDLWRPGLGLMANLSRLTRRRLARVFARDAGIRGLRRPERVFDLSQLMALDGKARMALLRRPARVTEMFCHPGDKRSDVEKPSSARRHDEFLFLTSEAFPRLCSSAGVRLVSFWEL